MGVQAVLRWRCGEVGDFCSGEWLRGCQLGLFGHVQLLGECSLWMPGSPSHDVVVGISQPLVSSSAIFFSLKKQGSRGEL